VAGDLSIRGRIKELINRGGEKISRTRRGRAGQPSRHSRGGRVSLAGQDVRGDGGRGDRSAGIRRSDPDELAEFCRDRLAAYEIPTSFSEAGELPHTAKGSLDRRAVVEQFGRPA